MAKHFLNRIDHFSIREKTGQEIIENVCGRKAEIVCDPTMLFTADEWLEIQQPEPLCKEKYIFCYFLGNNPEQRNFVKKLKQETGYNIVSILHLNVYAKCDCNFADIEPYDVGPAEFLNYIRHTEYVCTDSFHASVFSILYHKKFYVFRRFQESYALSTNSRLDTLLATLGLENRLFTGVENVQSALNDKIDYAPVDLILAKMRVHGYNFLAEALRE